MDSEPQRQPQLLYSFETGKLPLLISFPHEGHTIPDAVAAAMTEAGRSSRDTDWHLHRLYSMTEIEETHRLAAELSRYVIDLNRPVSDQSLYPGQTTTCLIPKTCFDGADIYKNDSYPDQSEINRRIDSIWKPYHSQIRATLDSIRTEHPVAVLLDAHSIRSQVPRLFEGQLPDFNIGTNHGTSCSPELEAAVMQVLRRQDRYSYVANGRFVGGHITRHYGIPEQRIHSLQIELSQATYMDESDSTWSEEKANDVSQVIGQILDSILNWAACQ